MNFKSIEKQLSIIKHGVEEILPEEQLKLTLLIADLSFRLYVL